MKKLIPIVVATIHPWNIAEYRRWVPPRGYKKVLIQKKGGLALERIRKINPAYIMFPHWSWIIPSEIYNNFECVVFHMTDLPFGRGGSPLQNLLVRGIYHTKISAIRVDGDIDAGDIYLKRPFNISSGSAENIFRRLSPIIFSMITDIIKKRLQPKAQSGKPTLFKRRTPEHSQLPQKLTARQLYDFIRMLDAPGYPPAFLVVGNVRVEFRKAVLRVGTVIVETVFYPAKDL